MRVAAIGIGSNSLRMLVADVDGGRLLRLDRYREGLRVFAALDRQGNIVADMIGKACLSPASRCGGGGTDPPVCHQRRA